MSQNLEQFPPIFMDPAELQELKDRSLFLDYLYDSGVDNWDGYSYAYNCWKKEIKSRNE